MIWWRCDLPWSPTRTANNISSSRSPRQSCVPSITNSIRKVLARETAVVHLWRGVNRELQLWSELFLSDHRFAIREILRLSLGCLPLVPGSPRIYRMTMEDCSNIWPLLLLTKTIIIWIINVAILNGRLLLFVDLVNLRQFCVYCNNVL